MSHTIGKIEQLTTETTRTFGKYKCQDCHDTGWGGDMGPGISGNREYAPCHCGQKHSFDWQESALKACAGLKYPEKEIKALVEAAKYVSDVGRCNCGAANPNNYPCRFCVLESALEPFKNYGEKI